MFKCRSGTGLKRPRPSSGAPNPKKFPLFLSRRSARNLATFKEGYNSGAVDYLFKPFDPTILQAKVAVFVDLYRKAQQIKRQAEALRESEERYRLAYGRPIKDYSLFILA